MSTAVNRVPGEPWTGAKGAFLASWGKTDPAELASQTVGARTSHVEAAVLSAWERHLSHVMPEGLALVAVGGYGRSEQFPSSDVDILLLTHRQGLPERERTAVADFLRALWDSSLRVSQSVHTPQECCELNDQNVELTISLLDQRFLAGDRTLYAKLQLGLPRFIHGQRQALARHLCKMARSRHPRHGGSIYQLEPNIKEGPGGLRDLQTLCWLAQVTGSQPDRIPARAVPDSLLPARDFLFALRCYLHFSSGRDQNTLSFDLEEEIAERLGLSPAEWMRGYYGHAREIWRATQRAIEGAEEQGSNLLLQFRDWRSRVSNADFYVSRERVYFRAPQRLPLEPPLAIGLAQFVARHGIRLACDAERRVSEHLPRLRQFFRQSQAVGWPAVKELLSQKNAALALRSMHETGLLGAVFPEWEPVDCLVVRDFYHRYTVDEHTLVAIEAVEELTSPRAGQDRRFRDLASEIDDPAVLKFALLFHDLGKAARSGKHTEVSVQLAEAAMARLQTPFEQRRAVRRLIEAHLELSAAMTSRDLHEPSTARALAEQVGTVELLKKLTLVTYADICAVNPTALSPWRLEQLWRVYVVTHNELTRELENDRIAPEAVQADEFLDGFPVRYLRTHSPEEIQAHREMASRARERGVSLDIRRDNGFFRLTLLAHDRPFLLASIAGALAGFGMNILKAEGFANRAGTILDEFVFTDPHHTLELNPSEIDRLRVMLERVTLGKTDVKSLLQHRPRPALPSKRSRLRPKVTFDQNASELATLVEIMAEDRPGLLYALASAISSAGGNIELVLIDTEAHKAIDVFYLTREGRKLLTAEQAALAEALYKACEV